MEYGIILTYLGQAIHILSGLLYTPVMLRLLGQSEYGLYQLVASTVGYLGILNLGFGGAYMRFYSRIKVKANEEDEVARLNGMFLSIFMLLSLIAFTAGMVMTQNIEAIFGRSFTAGEVQKAKILMIVLVFNLAVTFPMSLFDCYLMAHEQFVFQKIIVVLQYLLNPFITLPLLLMGYGSIAMIAVSTFLLALKSIANIYFCLEKLHMRFSFRNMQFRLLKEITGFTFFIFINQIVDQINWSLDKFLLGRYAGTAAVAVYAVAANLNGMYQQFSSAVPSVFVAKVNMAVARQDSKTEINRFFYTVGRMQLMVLGLIVSGVIVFGKPFIIMWAGDEYADAYQIVLLLMVPALIPYIQGLGYEIQRAMNMHRARSIAYFVVAVSNIFVSIPCIKAWGAKGAAFGTALTFIMGHGVFMNWYYHNKLKLDMIVFWKKIASVASAVGISLMIGLLGIKFIRIDNVIVLFGLMLMYAILYAVIMYFWGMNADEKQLVAGKVLSKICDVK